MRYIIVMVFLIIRLLVNQYDVIEKNNQKEWPKKQKKVPKIGLWFILETIRKCIMHKKFNLLTKELFLYTF
jgi:hypothetical protein